MNFEMYQMEKSQAIDLLDRVANHMLASEEDDKDATNTVMKLCREINQKRTQLFLMQLDAETLATMLEHVDATKTSAVEYFARYFSNFNTSVEEFRLAAGHALKPQDQLMSE